MAKRNSWRKFCDSVESTDEGARLHKILKRDTPILVGTLKNNSGGYTKTGREVIETLVETHFPDSNLVTNEVDPPSIGISNKSEEG